MTIYEGLIITSERTINDNIIPLTGKTQNYTQLNHLKFQLPPYKVYRNNETKEFISTRRPFADCLTGNSSKSGIRPRPLNGTYYILFDYDNKEANGTANDTCCWEWCDVPSNQCDHYKLEKIKHCEPKKITFRSATEIEYV